MNGGVVLEVESGYDEEDEAEQEADLLHPLAAVELIVDKERSQIVADQGAGDVNQVP